MRRNDFIILMICCLLWAGNFVVSAWTLGKNPVPPFMLATVRGLFVVLFLGAFLFKQRPKKFWRLLLVCFFVGPLHLGFLYTGLQTAEASWSAIVSQMLIPLTAILSIIFLRERVGWVRGVAIVGAFIGTLIIIYEPSTFALNRGLLCIVGAYISMAIGSILMKTVGTVDWRQYVAWTGVCLVVAMGLSSALFETGHGDVLANSKGPLLIAALYAAICVSAFSHGQYFRLIQSYDVTQVVPLTLVVPLFASILGVTLLGETLSSRVIIGALFILPCVYIIAARTKDQINDGERSS